MTDGKSFPSATEDCCREPDKKRFLRVAAPMVRYSKLPFRQLVRKYDVDIAFTPMIIADSFVQSPVARDVEFTTCPGDHPVIVQFAANKAEQFSAAAELVAPFVEGVDLNCGCPQRWAMKEGFGSDLITKPELVADIVKQTRQRINKPDFSVSIKIRILDDLRRTVDLCQQAVQAGVTMLSVHARTPRERTEPVRLETLVAVRDAVPSIPLIANGDVTTLADAVKIVEETGVDGVMSARGLLHNPALFAGYDSTPAQCVSDWVDVALSHGVNFEQFHHHLMYMLESSLPHCQRRVFNRLQSVPAVLSFLEQYVFVEL